MRNFKPAIGLSNKHLQTVYATLFRKPIKLKYEIEKFPLKDGDFLECYWHKTKKQNANSPLVILFRDVIPTKEELSDSITMELTQKGGHVGFVSGTLLKPEYWLEKRIIEYFKGNYYKNSATIIS